MKIRMLPLLAAALLAGATTVSQAAATGTYDLNLTFSFPATAVGSFHYDATTNAVTAVNITVNDANGPTVFDTNWNSVNGVPTFLLGGTTETLFLDNGHQTSNYNAGMYFSFDTAGPSLALVSSGTNFGSTSLYDWRDYSLYTNGQLAQDVVDLQHSSLTSAVPEPGTTALMGLALAGFALARRKRSQ